MGIAKHTPGPWKVIRHHHVDDELWLSVNREQATDGGWQWIAEIKYLVTAEAEQRANARLIAAAPDLLEVARQTEMYLNDIVNHASRDMAIHAVGAEIELVKARAAIAKATKASQ